MQGAADAAKDFAQHFALGATPLAYGIRVSVSVPVSLPRSLPLPVSERARERESNRARGERARARPRGGAQGGGRERDVEVGKPRALGNEAAREAASWMRGRDTDTDTTRNAYSYMCQGPGALFLRIAIGRPICVRPQAHCFCVRSVRSNCTIQICSPTLT